MSGEHRATFEACELAVVLSHYDLGVIESITEFPHGSRRSPKVGIVCGRGKFLLKRRSLQRVTPERMRFSHLLQQVLTQASFPLPRLVATRAGQTALQLRDYLYELYEFVPGERFDRSTQQAAAAAVSLAQFHEVMAGLPATIVGPQGDYHDAPGTRTSLHAIGMTLSSHDSFTGDEAELAGLMQALLSLYDRAAEAAERLELRGQPSHLIHGDYHPGNLLFRRGQVAAVLDFDSVRQTQRVIDVANAAMQFSLVRPARDAQSWPDRLDEERYFAFIGAYQHTRGLARLNANEISCVPHLMIESLIAETVRPIAETGSLGRWTGYRVLKMVRNIGSWIVSDLGRLSFRT